MSNCVIYMDISAFMCYFSIRIINNGERRDRIMINVSGHLRNERRVIGFVDETVPLAVNCCGMQIFKTKDYSQDRSLGRVDYQLIYVYKGIGHYFLNGKWNSITAGNILLFRPHEPQTYFYYANEHPEIYWIHFTGSDCEKLIEKYQIHNCYIGEHTLLKTLFQETIIELQLKKAYYDDIVLSSFLHMLVMIVRSRQQLLTSSENDFSIDRLVMQLNQHYMKDWTVSSMAKYCKLSVGYFSHIFKERMDAAPMHYLDDLRIEKAKELISTNTMKLSDVASMVGFSDSLYFSRVFKKTTGIPPKEYQQSLLTANTPNWWPDK